MKQHIPGYHYLCIQTEDAQLHGHVSEHEHSLFPLGELQRKEETPNQVLPWDRPGTARQVPI